MVPRLLQAGHDVVGLDTDLYAGCDFGEPPVDVPSICVDVRDVETRHCRGFDAVIHLAALSNDPLGDLDPQITYAINHRASVRLAECAKAAGVGRYLFSSSCSLYGAAGDQALGEEAATLTLTDDLSALEDALARAPGLPAGPFPRAAILALLADPRPNLRARYLHLLDFLFCNRVGDGAAEAWPRLCALPPRLHARSAGDPDVEQCQITYPRH